MMTMIASLLYLIECLCRDSTSELAGNVYKFLLRSTVSHCARLQEVADVRKFLFNEEVTTDWEDDDDTPEAGKA